MAGLTITVVEGQGLGGPPKPRKPPVRDPMLVVRAGSEKRTTKVKFKEGPDPKWNQPLPFYGASPKTHIWVQCYDGGNPSADALVGELRAPLSELLMYQTAHGIWLQLTESLASDKPVGKVLLLLKTDIEPDYARPTAPAAEASATAAKPKRKPAAASASSLTASNANPAARRPSPSPSPARRPVSPAAPIRRPVSAGPGGPTTRPHSTATASHAHAPAARPAAAAAPVVAPVKRIPGSRIPAPASGPTRPPSRPTSTSPVPPTHLVTPTPIPVVPAIDVQRQDGTHVRQTPPPSSTTDDAPTLTVRVQPPTLSRTPGTLPLRDPAFEDATGHLVPYTPPDTSATSFSFASPKPAPAPSLQSSVPTSALSPGLQAVALAAASVAPSPPTYDAYAGQPRRHSVAGAVPPLPAGVMSPGVSPIMVPVEYQHPPISPSMYAAVPPLPMPVPGGADWASSAASSPYAPAAAPGYPSDSSPHLHAATAVGGRVAIPPCGGVHAAPVYKGPMHYASPATVLPPQPTGGAGGAYAMPELPYGYAGGYPSPQPVATHGTGGGYYQQQQASPQAVPVHYSGGGYPVAVATHGTGTMGRGVAYGTGTAGRVSTHSTGASIKSIKNADLSKPLPYTPADRPYVNPYVLPGQR
ncbi:hypothetical protein H9P43_004278 [Blastocladiella emersonii ATCC 22665]|nr:hypothetical protein H9P43_004278 [Blastocladiella emersonii ATCC 22665]